MTEQLTVDQGATRRLTGYPEMVGISRGRAA